MINIKNSLLFLSICRNTLNEMNTDKDLKYFLMYEASDYQIMNIIVNDEIPLEKYDALKEQDLWNNFQHTLQENSSRITSKLFINLGPISEYNLSSSKTVVEFLREVDQPKFVSNMFNKINSLKKTATKTYKQGVNAAKDNPVAGALTAAASISAIVYAAHMIYKNFLSTAAKACKGKPDKVACMRQYKSKALRLKIDKLKSGLGRCAKAKNVENCKKSLQSKIKKTQEKIAKI